MSLLIRDAQQGDVPAILALWEALIEAHRALEPALYALAPNARETYAAFLRRLRTDRDGIVLLATADAAPVGYLAGGAGRRAPVYAVRDVGMIFDLSVAPGRRREGVGEALVRAALTRFRARGLAYAQVNFAPENPSASAFWPKLGFETFLREAYLPLADPAQSGATRPDQ